MGSAGAAESVLYSPHFALVLSGLGQAVLCRAEPGQWRRRRTRGSRVKRKGEERAPQESSDLLSAMASSRSSCSCWVSLASRSFSSRSLSRFAHSIMSSSVGYCSMNTENTHTYTQTHTHKGGEGKSKTNAKKCGGERRQTHVQLTDSQR